MVLVVDKDKDVLSFYRDFYNDISIHSVGFTDAEEAYNFFAKFHKSFSLITTGLEFSHKNDGLWLARNIKKISTRPIILITGRLPPKYLENGLFSSVLIKPINFDDLAALISFWHSKP